ncbi:sortase domain-containing protein [Saccharothrix isguenensis]
MPRSAVLLLVATLSLPACGTQPTTTATTTTTTTSTNAATATTSPAPHAYAGHEPTEVRIPRIDATSSLIPLGLNPDETVQVPSIEQPMQAGWYVHARAPGEPGPAIILGHVDGNSQPGIFYRLHELRPGAGVEVSRTDGSVVEFTVEKVDHPRALRKPVAAAPPDRGRRQRTTAGSGAPPRQRRPGRHSTQSKVLVTAFFHCA